MSKRLTKALLRLCELEKKALETELDFWKQEVKLNTQAFKEIEETNRQLQDGLRELETLRSQNTAMSDQVAKVRFERDQARVALKGLAEENARLRKNTGWVHVSCVSAQGCPREVLGVGADGSVRLLRFDGLHQFSSLNRSNLRWEHATSPYYVMEIPPISGDSNAEETAVGNV